MNFYNITDTKDNNNLLYKRICELLDSKEPFYNKVWFLFGVSQESAYSLIKKEINWFINDGGTVNFVISIDSKNTTANYLNTLLENRINTWIFNNNKTGFKRNPHMIVFESEDSRAEVIITSADFTEEGLLNNYETTVNLQFDDKEEYKAFRKSIEEYLKPKKDTYTKLNENHIKMLQENNELASDNMDFISKLPNINELRRGFRKKDSENTKKIISDILKQQKMQNEQIASTKEVAVDKPNIKDYDSEDDILIDINI